MREGDNDTFDRLITKARGAVLPADRVITARGRRDSVAVSRWIAELRGDPRFAQFPTRYLWIYFEDDVAAEQVGQVGTQAGSEPVRLLSTLGLADLDVARGRWQNAQSRLAGVQRMNPFYAQTMRRVCATLPFFELPRADLEAVRDELRAWDGAAPAVTDVTVRAMMPHARLYLLALVNARLGDYDRARSHANELKQLSDPTGQPAVVDAMVRTVRAQIAAQQGRPAEVVALLEPVRGQIPLPLLRRKDVVPIDYIFSQDHARFLRGRALRELGRADQALPWLSTSFIGATGELVYRAPLHLELAQTYESMGQPDKAREHYSRFLRAWHAADPAMQPQVSAARARLVRLSPDR
ncbi:MAG: tetratricopeptide repeat protein [Gemmatimonadota bacterium]